MDIETFMELLAKDLKIEDATELQNFVDLANNFKNEYVFNTVQLCLIIDYDWGRFLLPWALVPTIKAKLKIEGDW